VEPAVAPLEKDSSKKAKYTLVQVKKVGQEFEPCSEPVTIAVNFALSDSKMICIELPEGKDHEEMRKHAEKYPALCYAHVYWSLFVNHDKQDQIYRLLLSRDTTLDKAPEIVQEVIRGAISLIHDTRMDLFLRIHKTATSSPSTEHKYPYDPVSYKKLVDAHSTSEQSRLEQVQLLRQIHAKSSLDELQSDFKVPSKYSALLKVLYSPESSKITGQASLVGCAYMLCRDFVYQTHLYVVVEFKSYTASVLKWFEHNRFNLKYGPHCRESPFETVVVMCLILKYMHDTQGANDPVFRPLNEKDKRAWAFLHLKFQLYPGALYKALFSSDRLFNFDALKVAATLRDFAFYTYESVYYQGTTTTTTTTTRTGEEGEQAGTDSGMTFYRPLSYLERAYPSLTDYECEPRITFQSKHDAPSHTRTLLDSLSMYGREQPSEALFKTFVMNNFDMQFVNKLHREYLPCWFEGRVYESEYYGLSSQKYDKLSAHMIKSLKQQREEEDDCSKFCVLLDVFYGFLLVSPIQSVTYKNGETESNKSSKDSSTITFLHEPIPVMSARAYWHLKDCIADIKQKMSVRSATFDSSMVKSEGILYYATVMTGKASSNHNQPIASLSTSNSRTLQSLLIGDPYRRSLSSRLPMSLTPPDWSPGPIKNILRVLTGDSRKPYSTDYFEWDIVRSRWVLKPQYLGFYKRCKDGSYALEDRYLNQYHKKQQKWRNKWDSWHGLTSNTQGTSLHVSAKHYGALLNSTIGTDSKAQGHAPCRGRCYTPKMICSARKRRAVASFTSRDATMIRIVPSSSLSIKHDPQPVHAYTIFYSAEHPILNKDKGHYIKIPLIRTKPVTHEQISQIRLHLKSQMKSMDGLDWKVCLQDHQLVPGAFAIQAYTLKNAQKFTHDTARHKIVECIQSGPHAAFLDHESVSSICKDNVVYVQGVSVPSTGYSCDKITFRLL
jgi:hypothetical protein